MIKTLKEYAEENRVQYRTAWNYFKAGKIPNAYKNSFNKIVINDNKEISKETHVVCYARVSSSQNKKNLETQSERLVSYANAKGYKINQVIKECASGLNDKRPKLLKLLKSSDPTVIIVEHQDRLTRFGYNYIKNWMLSKNCVIEIINQSVNDKQDLMQDFVSLVTSFVARLYGLRRSKRKTEKLIKELQDDKKVNDKP